MSRIRVPLRIAPAACLVALLLLAAASTATGYLFEARSQQADRDHRLAAAAAYVDAGLARVGTTQWREGLTGKLAALHLNAELTIASPRSKRSIYQPHAPASESKTGDPGSSDGGRPAATYVFPLAADTGQTLRLNLFARPLDRNHRVLVALASGLAGLLVGLAVVIWAADRWLVRPLRRLNAQVEAIAGGERVRVSAASPVREVHNIATAIGGMTDGLAQAAEHDARLEAERRLLLGSIAHDLRTPLFALRGYLDAIAAGIGDPGERLDRARAKARQIDRLVTDLFNYTRAEIDAQPQLQPTDLGEAVSAATSGFELAADERRIELRVDAPAGTQVKIDRDAFERALANVIDNAVRHTPRDGTIDIAAGEDADGAYVHVVDDGPGITSDLLPRIFEPMVRANGTHDGGAGLGLTIAARLLHNQGGTIEAANASGRGAVLTLRLPSTAAPAADRVGEVALSPPGHAGRAARR